MTARDEVAVLIEAVADAFTTPPADAAGTRNVGSPAEPWHAWMLAALVRQLWRQSWLVKVVEECGLRDGSAAGTIPGMPDHAFRFHGIGCCFSLPDGDSWMSTSGSNALGALCSCHAEVERAVRARRGGDVLAIPSSSCG